MAHCDTHWHSGSTATEVAPDMLAQVPKVEQPEKAGRIINVQ